MYGGYYNMGYGPNGMPMNGGMMPPFYYNGYGGRGGGGGGGAAGRGFAPGMGPAPPMARMYAGPPPPQRVPSAIRLNGEDGAIEGPGGANGAAPGLAPNPFGSFMMNVRSMSGNNLNGRHGSLGNMGGTSSFMSNPGGSSVGAQSLHRIASGLNFDYGNGSQSGFSQMQRTLSQPGMMGGSQMNLRNGSMINGMFSQRAGSAYSGSGYFGSLRGGSAAGGGSAMGPMGGSFANGLPGLGPQMSTHSSRGPMGGSFRVGGAPGGEGSMASGLFVPGGPNNGGAKPTTPGLGSRSNSANSLQRQLSIAGQFYDYNLQHSNSFARPAGVGPQMGGGMPKMGGPGRWGPAAGTPIPPPPPGMMLPLQMPGAVGGPAGPFRGNFMLHGNNAAIESLGGGFPSPATAGSPGQMNMNNSNSNNNNLANNRNQNNNNNNNAMGGPQGGGFGGGGMQRSPQPPRGPRPGMPNRGVPPPRSGGGDAMGPDDGSASGQQSGAEEDTTAEGEPTPLGRRNSLGAQGLKRTPSEKRVGMYFKNVEAAENEGVQYKKEGETDGSNKSSSRARDTSLTNSIKPTLLLEQTGTNTAVEIEGRTLRLTRPGQEEVQKYDMHSIVFVSPETDVQLNCDVLDDMRDHFVYGCNVGMIMADAHCDAADPTTWFTWLALKTLVKGTFAALKTKHEISVSVCLVQDDKVMDLLADDTLRFVPLVVAESPLFGNVVNEVEFVYVDDAADFNNTLDVALQRASRNSSGGEEEGIVVVTVVLKQIKVSSSSGTPDVVVSSIFASGVGDGIMHYNRIIDKNPAEPRALFYSAMHRSVHANALFCCRDTDDDFGDYLNALQRLSQVEVRNPKPGSTRSFATYGKLSISKIEDEIEKAKEPRQKVAMQRYLEKLRLMVRDAEAMLERPDETVPQTYI